MLIALRLVFDNFIRRGRTRKRERGKTQKRLLLERARRIRRVKLRRAYGGCLGTGRRRRTRIAAKSLGEPLNRHRSGDVRMGKPGRGNCPVIPGGIHTSGRPTRGSETSQYPQEQKSTRDSLSSGERTGKSPNRLCAKPAGVAGTGLWGGVGGRCGALGKSEIPSVVEAFGTKRHRG